MCQPCLRVPRFVVSFSSTKLFHDWARVRTESILVFTRLEATLVLATIGQEWTMEWAGEETEISYGPEITMQTENGLPMRLTTR
jgi:hypothetical protein